MNEKIKIEAKYKLKDVELLNVVIIHPDTPLPHSSDFQFTINIEHRTNIEKKLVFVLTAISIIHQESSTELGSIKTSCIFLIDNIEAFIKEKEKKQISFSNSFIKSLNSISISTTRGIMFSQFSGTYLRSAILPLINLGLIEDKTKK